MRLSKVVGPLMRFLSWQYSALSNHLDPIAVDSTPANTSTSKWDWIFLPLFLALVISVLHGNVLMPIQAGVPLSWNSLSRTPALILRQIYHRAMWPQTDIAISIATFASLAIFASFWRNPWTIARYWRIPGKKQQLTLQIGNTQLNSDSSQAILKYHGRIKLFSFTLVAILLVAILIFVYSNIYRNGFYGLSFNLVLTCLLFLPAFCFAMLYGNF